jgi:cobalt-zinc-cadmium efflux system membrane fusion protein
MQANEIILGSPVERKMSEEVLANGVVDMPPQYKASVSTIMPGFVQHTDILEGDLVKKGEVLAVLTHTDYISLQQQYVEAKSRSSFLLKELERQKQLREENINSRKEFERIESELAINQAKENSLKATLHMLGIDPEKVLKGEISSTISIRSPLAGAVTKVNITIGKLIRSEEVLFEIISREHLHIDLKVYEKDVMKVKEGQKVMVKISNVPEEKPATIILVGKSLDPQNRTVSIHAHPDNGKDNLIPGMYVKGRIFIEERLVKALPEEAVIREGDKNYIFIKTSSAGDKVFFEKKEVETGVIQDGYVEVTLSPDIHGEIVIKGAYFLFAGTKKGEE